MRRFAPQQNLSFSPEDEDDLPPNSDRGSSVSDDGPPNRPSWNNPAYHRDPDEDDAPPPVSRPPPPANYQPERQRQPLGGDQPDRQRQPLGGYQPREPDREPRYHPRDEPQRDDPRFDPPPPRNQPRYDDWNNQPPASIPTDPDYVHPVYGKRPNFNFGFGPRDQKPLASPPPPYDPSRQEPERRYQQQPPPPQRYPYARSPAVVDGANPVVADDFARQNRDVRSSRPSSLHSGARSISTGERPGPRPPRPPEARQKPKKNKEPKKQDALNKVRGDKEREEWDNKVQYLLAVVGYAVGLGNVWRFPYLAQKNGGGAFLIPYLTMLVLEGVPLLILELQIGQRFKRGPLLTFRDISPFGMGIGMACVVSSFLAAAYYNTVITWCFYYMFASLRTELPWEKCPNAGNLDNAVDLPECERLGSASQYYWYREALNIADDIEQPGGLNWLMVLAMLGAWSLICICMIKGIKSSGKVVYFTATFPYVVLTVFLIRGVTLEGAGDGLAHFLTPDMSRILDGEVWMEAATQIFFTLSLAGGGLISMSSYNSYDNNFFKDAFIVAGINSATSLYAGCVIFSIVGYMANIKYDRCLEMRQLEMENFASSNITCDLTEFLKSGVSGSGLAFQTIAEACTQFDWGGPFFSFIFYFMLITLGMDSMFGILEAVIASLTDLSRLKNVDQKIIVGVTCGLGFLLGIMFTSVTGEYVFQMFNEYVGSLPLLIIALSECILVGWVYGIDKFASDFYYMTGFRPNIVLLVFVKFICPAIMIAIFGVTMVNLFMEGATYERYDKAAAATSVVGYPLWADFMCGLLTIVCTGWIPAWAIYYAVAKRDLFPEDDPEHFPVAELRKHHQLPLDDYDPPALMPNNCCGGGGGERRSPPPAYDNGKKYQTGGDDYDANEPAYEMQGREPDQGPDRYPDYEPDYAPERPPQPDAYDGGADSFAYSTNDEGFI